MTVNCESKLNKTHTPMPVVKDDFLNKSKNEHFKDDPMEGW